MEGRSRTCDELVEIIKEKIWKGSWSPALAQVMAEPLVKGKGVGFGFSSISIRIKSRMVLRKMKEFVEEAIAEFFAAKKIASLRIMRVVSPYYLISGQCYKVDSDFCGDEAKFFWKRVPKPDRLKSFGAKREYRHKQRVKLP